MEWNSGKHMYSVYLSARVCYYNSCLYIVLVYNNRWTPELEHNGSRQRDNTGSSL